MLLNIGEELLDIYRSKRKSTTDSYKEIMDMLVAHLNPKTVVYTEVCVFRRAMRFEGETASDYAMRLRGLAKHCEFNDVDREILQQFIIGIKRPDVERKCCTTENLDLAKAIDLATNFENLEANLNGLHATHAQRNISLTGMTSRLRYPS